MRLVVLSSLQSLRLLTDNRASCLPEDSSIRSSSSVSCTIQVPNNGLQAGERKMGSKVPALDEVTVQQEGSHVALPGDIQGTCSNRVQKGL